MMSDMNIVRPLFFLLVIGMTAIFSSCDKGKGDEDLPKKTGVLITNEGNFSFGNGSVSFYDEESMTVTNNVIKNANDGAEIGALVQSIYQHDGIGYLLCNDTDKIEFFSLDNYRFLANPEDNIAVPRYMTVVGDKGYVTCWGPYDDNYGLPDSYIAVLDLAAKLVVDTLDCGSGPEGIFALNNKLFVANSFETTVSVIDLSDHSETKINFDAAPQYLVPDGQGNIWISLASGWLFPAEKSGIQSINASTLEKGSFVHTLDVEGAMAINATGEKIYLLTAQIYPETGTAILEFNTSTKSFVEEPLITGDNFYGIGYNVTTDKIYVSDSKAFSGPGQIYVYDATGMLLNDQVTGIGPNGFVFK